MPPANAWPAITAVIPGRASWREPGIHWAPNSAGRWLPGSCDARPRM